jgi:C-terminal processing protease CtpA/Prc
MKTLSFAVVCLASIVLGGISHAQPVPDSVYYERLYYTGKTWGFVKYFHSEVAKGGVNWDVKLAEVLADVKASVTNQDFNDALSGLLDMAGETAVPTTSLPDLPDSLKYNLDLNWLDDEIFSTEVRARLDTIRVRFRPQTSVFVGEAFAGGNPTFDNDTEFYEWGVYSYPNEEHRLLALFRYWNIINYFYPYKYILDQDWDSTLFEFIPRVLSAPDEISFHSCILELATRLNDSHAYTYSEIINSYIVGRYYLPLTLQFVENETVITGVFDESDSVSVGDVIISINGLDIHTLRDSLRTYTAGSNVPVTERNINTRLLKGPYETVQMVVENSEGQREVTVARDVYVTDYSALIAREGPVWSILDEGSKSYGYVDMGRLEVAQITTMFADLWDTDGIIFDIRNYPQGTMWYMIRYLFHGPIHIANFTVPDIKYPGTLSWKTEHVGFGDFSQTYENSVFILLDERTQSQAEYTVMAMEQHPKAIKIGSQTAGADGNVSAVYLPGGIVAYLTGLGVFYPDFSETQRIGIVPDVELHPTIAGIREGRDELLETALQYTPTGIADDNTLDPHQLPDTYLFQNCPNPFNPTTEIEFVVPTRAEVRLEVFSILGRRVATLVNGSRGPGRHSVVWDAGAVASGVYLYRLKAGDFTATRKMLLLK